MHRIVAIVVGLGLVGVCPSAATAQSSELAALAAHVQALQTMMTAQAQARYSTGQMRAPPFPLPHTFSFVGIARLSMIQ